MTERQFTATPPAEGGITHVAKLDKAEARLDCHQPADLPARCVRVLNPTPDAATLLSGLAEPVNAWRAVGRLIEVQISFARLHPRPPWNCASYATSSAR